MALGINSKKTIKIIAMSPVGNGLSGSDRIFIELARNLSKMDMNVKIITWRDGLQMCEKSQLNNKDIKFEIIDMHIWPKMGFVINYFARIVYILLWSIKTKIPNPSNTYIYSSSEFWMDAFPAVILRFKSKSKWIATWFQTAPNPLRGFAEGRREKKYRFNALLYWLSQQPVKILVKRFADYVLVNNETEISQYKNLNKRSRLFIFIGAIDLDKINKWKIRHHKIEKKYDAVFQGRFHPQKGIVELIEIWSNVVKKIPKAKLAVIGDGPLRKEVEKKIMKCSLGQNVDLLGYVFDGDKKYTTFAQSRIVLHPALFDSGGMAAAEAMAFGLPCVGFDLKAYESYYPKGMVKVPVGDLDAFSNQTTLILRDKALYNRTRSDALGLVKNKWSWKDRALEFKEFISKNND